MEPTLRGDDLSVNNTHRHSQFLCEEGKNKIKEDAKKNNEVRKRVAITRDNDRMARLLVPLLQGGRDHNNPGIAL